MKCEACGQEQPSKYYFRTRALCNECFEKLAPADQKKALENEDIVSARADAKKYSLHGRELICPFCGYDQFWIRDTLLNTRGATFWGVEWANKQAQNYICNHCGYVFWFLREE